MPGMLGIRIHTAKGITVCVCVCVCACARATRERERERRNAILWGKLGHAFNLFLSAPVVF